MKFLKRDIRRHDEISFSFLCLNYYKKIIESLYVLVDDYDSSDIIKKYHAINRLFDIRYSYEDYAKIFNAKYNTDFTKIVDLSTNMEKKTYYIDGKVERIRCHYKCLAVDTFNESSVKYSYNDIVKLTDEGFIRPVSSYNEKIDKCSKNRKKPQHISTLDHNGLGVWERDNYYSIFPSDDFIPYVMKGIDSSVDKKEMYNDMKLFISDLESKLRDYLHYYSYCANYDYGSGDTLNIIQKLYNDSVCLNKIMIKK